MLNGIFDTAGMGQVYQPLLWVGTYHRVPRSSTSSAWSCPSGVTLMVTLLALAVLVVLLGQRHPEHGFRPAGR